MGDEAEQVKKKEDQAATSGYTLPPVGSFDDRAMMRRMLGLGRDPLFQFDLLPELSNPLLGLDVPRPFPDATEAYRQLLLSYESPESKLLGTLLYDLFSGDLRRKHSDLKAKPSASQVLYALGMAGITILTQGPAYSVEGDSLVSSDEWSDDSSEFMDHYEQNLKLGIGSPDPWLGMGSFLFGSDVEKLLEHDYFMNLLFDDPLATLVLLGKTQFVYSMILNETFTPGKAGTLENPEWYNHLGIGLGILGAATKKYTELENNPLSRSIGIGSTVFMPMTGSLSWSTYGGGATFDWKSDPGGGSGYSLDAGLGLNLGNMIWSEDSDTASLGVAAQVSASEPTDVMYDAGTRDAMRYLIGVTGGDEWTGGAQFGRYTTPGFEMNQLDLGVGYKAAKAEDALGIGPLHFTSFGLRGTYADMQAAEEAEGLAANYASRFGGGTEAYALRFQSYIDMMYEISTSSQFGLSGQLSVSSLNGDDPYIDGWTASLFFQHLLDGQLARYELAYSQNKYEWMDEHSMDMHAILARVKVGPWIGGAQFNWANPEQMDKLYHIDLKAQEDPRFFAVSLMFAREFELMNLR